MSTADSQSETIAQLSDDPASNENSDASGHKKAKYDTSLSSTGPTQTSDDEDERPLVNMENFSGPFLTWVENPSVQAEISRIFRWFVKTFTRENSSAPLYLARVKRMARENGASLEVDYNDLAQAVQNVAIWLADHPERVLPLLDAAATDVVTTLFPGYERICPAVHVRVAALPIEDKLRELRQLHLGRLVRVFGVVTKRTAVLPQLKVVRFSCAKCSYLSLPVTHAACDKEALPPSRCRGCGSKGPFRINSQTTVYRNFQRINLQESPGSVPAGRVPRRKEIILTDDLIDSVRPGEEVGITGIYKNQFEISLNVRNGFPVFETVIEANHIQRVRQSLESDLTEEDKRRIRSYAARPNICQIIINSIAPSIHGHIEIKEALALALFGGVAKEGDKGRHRLRGDINVLILGDPGTAKSQFLKYIEKAAPRAVYATGKGASGVGLTAAVQKDPKTREWVLEGGALVLADQGLCLIDEFDKMNETDRTSIHEAMEQQTISISKAGIVATLQARCGVVAAANPIKERYDSSATFLENVGLSDTILSRFDIIRIVKDIVDPIEDERLATFVIKSHIKNHPLNNGKSGVEDDDVVMSGGSQPPSGQSSQEDPIEKMPQDLLKKYISFAKSTVRPRINQINKHKVIKVYSELRKESMREGAIPIGVRHIEAIIRMAEARAKMSLRDYVSNDDLDAAISATISSFIDTQKFSFMRAMRKRFQRFLSAAADFEELLSHVLAELFREEQQFRSFMAERASSELLQGPLEVDRGEFEEKAKLLEIFDVSPFYRSARFLELFGVDFKRNRVWKK